MNDRGQIEKNNAKISVRERSYALYFAGIIIVLFTLFSFSSVYQADFVNLDDHGYVLKNENIRELSLKNTAKLFLHPSGDMYIPLVYFSYSVEYFFSELDPHRFHVDNVLLHSINAILILWLVWMLTKSLRLSATIAALFALHPLHVESVAWISERKDVLYALFFLAAIICYHFYCQNNKKRYYLTSLALFIMSCMSKPMAITLPVVLVLYDYFYLQQRSIKTFINKIPFFIISLACSIIALAMLRVSFVDEYNATYNIFDKAIMVLYAIFFYISKTLLPINLSAMYTYPIKTGTILPVYYLICALATLIMFWFVFLSRYCPPFVKAFFLFYLITIFPVLQFFANTYTVTADRYSYIPTLGILAILVYYLDMAIRNEKITGKQAWILAVSTIMLSAIATKSRSKVWYDSLSLYTNIVKRGQYTEAAMCTLGDAYMDQHNYLKAISVFKTADSIYTNRYPVAIRYAAALAEAGQYDEAIAQYRHCLVIDPAQVDIYVNLGSAYLKQGRHTNALKIFLEGLARAPNNNFCLYNIGYTYWSMDNKPEAIKYFKTAAANNFQPAIDFIRNNY